MEQRKIISTANPNDVLQLKAALLSSGCRIIKELPLINGFLCDVPEGQVITTAMRGFENKVSVEEDIKFKLCYLPGFFFPFKSPVNQPQQPFPAKPVTPAKPTVPLYGGIKSDWGIKRIGAPQVWNKLKERRVRVGIIDTGIDYTHPDLKDNFQEGISTLDGQSSYLDDYGHGTHVAGTIGAANRFGMVGINPYVDFYAVKAFDKKGSGNLSDIIEGMDWLLRKQVDVINMSFSTSETSSVFVRVIQAAYRRGVVMVAAAGNDGGDVNFPARFPEVIAVSAIDSSDNLASFSSHGPEINFCAPGVDINSTWLNGGYAVKSGTSFAAPHVTGSVADLLNYYGQMPPGQIRNIMSRGAVTIEQLTIEQQGAGLVELPRLII